MDPLLKPLTNMHSPVLTVSEHAMLCGLQPEKIKVPVQCHVGTEDKFVPADVSDSAPPCEMHSVKAPQHPYADRKV